MTRSRDLDPVLLTRYLSGESTPAEAALVHAWAAADPRHAAELETLRRAWSSNFPLERRVDVDAGWRSLAASMHSPSLGHATERPEPSVAPPVARIHLLHGSRNGPRQRAMSRLLGYAAAAAVVIGAAGVVTYRATTRRGGDATPRTTREFAAGPGERALVDLTDGTHIVLAPETRLRVTLPTGRTGVRELTLDGEAMFTVTHDAAHPFVVHSRYGTTLDVGTSFSVRAYADEAYRVVVRDGRVALGNAKAPILVAGDVATRGSDGAMHVAHAQDAASLLDWSNGRIAFDHTRFVDLVPELERWYGVQITIASPGLRDRYVTGALDTESRDEAMRALGRTLGAQHVTDGAHVTFSLPSGR